ncbi:SusC/RagA family TonB-linked outer membrane protein [Pseudochryseolinea flava]|uniref:SusC/RagA family TonB-linked outer membrane protein n=1 Tax=Pseudochryseolinea flava TaxID=2059302 RepID=A0A364Y1T5_9BACT|nr:SusC/RagA family TonB-linked outer membrane protein [Pseudochryseolinea flava]RAV99909.1 SusC/RagA family TonB-linked outer membrane protein [Pseudochryseolinea flava]
MKRILLLCLTAVFALVSSELWAQERTVTGRITSQEDGSGLPGVNVVLKGTTQGTVSNANGDYTISVPASGGTLVFTFIGLLSQEVEIGSRNVVDVPMQQDVTQLSEVVVTALGQEQSKKEIGYAVQEVKGEDLLKSRDQNIVNSLSGKIAGVQVTGSSGAVGASSRILIRGANSFGNNQPLFVVDGVPISNGNFGGTGNEDVNRGNGAADINPDDVESVTVLKGPNASALYGSRASNGVILITTKRGKKGSGLGISFNSNVTFENPMKLPDYQNGYGQGSNGEFEFVDGKGGGINDGVDESWGPRLDVGTKIPQFNSPVVNGVREATPWVSHPDNVKDFFNTGTTITNSVAINGGTDKAGVRLSYTNSKQEGMVPNTDQTKNTVALNANVELTERFSLNASGTFVKTNSDNLPGYGYSAQNVMQQFNWFGRQVDIAALKNYKNADGSKFSWNYNYHNNPYFILYENLNTLDRSRIYGNARLNYRITDWLSAFVRTGTDYYTNTNTGRTALGDLDTPPGSYSETTNTVSETNSDFLISFNKDVAQDFNLNINAGGNQMNQKSHQIFGAADELSVADVFTLNNSRVPLRTSSEWREKRINSLYGAVKLSYKEALTLEITGRNDWSSTLPEANNSYFYPSVNVSASLADLFDLQSNTLSFLKVRGGWARVGSDTDPYQLLNTVSFGDSWNSATKLPNLFVPNRIPNSELEPEESESFEIGADVNFFTDKLRFELTYYDRKTKNQIIDIPISGASGYTTKTINAGQISNRGIEIHVGATPVSLSNGFRWDVDLNFAKNINQVDELYPGVEQYLIATYWSLQVVGIPGQRLGSLFGYGFERDPNGNIIHEDGLPVTSTTAKVLGNYTPDWTAGFNSQFSYKGFTLYGQIDVKRGGDLYSMTTSWGRYAGILEETLLGREDGIVGDGVKNIGTAENPEYVQNDIVVTAEQYNKAAYSNSIAESSVFDGSYVKLREVRLGYTVPNSIFGRLPFKDLNVALVGRNLALLYSTVPHVDPETSFSNTNAQGLEFGQLPSARSIGFNISFKLQ